MASRWSDDSSVLRGGAYQGRFDDLAAEGVDVHGEAALVANLVDELGLAAGRSPSVLDAGCGTGRVAIELARGGFAVEGVDADPEMLDEARRRAPDLTWHHADLATLDLVTLDLTGRFDAVVLAGNVLVFVQPGTEADVVSRCAAALQPGGLLIAGFQVRPGGYGPDQLDVDATAAGLRLHGRWSTWDRLGWVPGGDYQVSAHRRSPAG